MCSSDLGKTNLGLALVNIIDFMQTCIKPQKIYGFNCNSKLDYSHFKYDLVIDGKDVTIDYKRAADYSFVEESLYISGEMIYRYAPNETPYIEGNLSKIGAEALI